MLLLLLLLEQLLLLLLVVFVYQDFATSKLEMLHASAAAGAALLADAQNGVLPAATC